MTFPFIRGEKRVSMLVGNETALIIRNKISNWRTFINVFWDYGVSPRYESVFAKTIHEVTGANTLGFDLNDLMELMDGLRELPPDTLLRGMYNTMGFNKHISMALRSVFMIWKHHLESLIVRFNHVRTEYITKHKLKDPPNDISKLIQAWKVVDTKHKINTSSKILFYSMPPDDLSKVVWVSARRWASTPEKFMWEIKKSPVSHPINEFLAAIESNGFVYPGFCPKRPVSRLNALLKFPIKELIVCIKALGGKIDMEYCELLGKIPSIQPFKRPVGQVKLTKLPELEQVCKKYGVTKVRSIGSIVMKSLIIRWGVDDFIDQLKHNTELIKEVEADYVRKVDAIVCVGTSLRDHVYGNKAE